MFTGIVKELGKVKKFTPKGDVYSLVVKCAEVSKGIDIGDSIAVNGVCLSVVKINKDSLVFDAVRNTVKNTNLRRLRVGSVVNLENALRLGDDISGHMVSGHVDGERSLKANKKTRKGWVLDVKLLPGDEKYIVSKGSIAIDGISLTVGEVLPGAVRIFIIPHTLENTSLSGKKAGDHVNVEFDLTAKYAAKGSSGAINMDSLRHNGFA